MYFSECWSKRFFIANPARKKSISLVNKWLTGAWDFYTFAMLFTLCYLRHAGLVLCLLLLVIPAFAVESPSPKGFGSTPENNPFHHLWWVPRELIPKEFIDELVPEVCQGTYLPLLDDYAEEGKLNILADTVTVDESKYSTLLGNVEGVARNMRFFADEGRVDRANNLVDLRGNVRFYQVDIALTGNQGILNTATGEFTLDNVQYARGTTRARLHTNLLSRDASGVFHLQQASYTTCEPGRSDWRVYGSKLDLDYVKGWGTIRHAVLFVREIPVFYFPWFRFPLDKRRHTGLLVPQITLSGANGITFTQPIYLNLAPHYDATLTPRYYGLRGLYLDSEGRLLTSYGHNTLTYGYIKDAEYGAARSLQALVHDGGYDLPWRSTVDYRKASDPSYYKDLDFTLVNSSNNDLLNQYGEIGLVRGPLRATFGSYDYQPLVGYDGKTYARLPGADIYYTKRMGNFGLDILANYNDFMPRRTAPFSAAEIASGTKVNGVRKHASVTPGLYLRDAYGKLELFTRHQFTDYQLKDTGGLEATQSRSVHSAVALGNLIFDRETDFSGADLTQTLELEAQLLETEVVDQNQVPNFTTSEPRFTYASVFAFDRFNGEDRIGDTRQLSYGLATSLLDANSIDIFRFQIGQIYYDRDRQVTLAANDMSLRESIRYTRQFSPLAMRTSMVLPRNFRLTNDLVWDQRISRNLLNLWTFHKTLGTRSFFTLGYNLLTNEITSKDDSIVETEQLNGSGIVQVNSHWAVFGRSFYDREKSEFIERLIGVEYENCCWRITLGQFDRTDFDTEGLPSETGAFVQFHLKGLLGSETSQGKAKLGDINSALEKAIPGFTSRKLYLPD